MPEPRELEGWIAEHGITSVRLIATNHDGLALGKYVTPAKFVSGADRGFQLADTAFGVDFDGDVAIGWDWGDWRGEVIDVIALPDLDTLVADPALPGLASVMCDFLTARREPVPVCGRGMLQRLVGQLSSQGLEARVAPELEFSVFEEPIQVARERGFRGLTPLGGPSRITYLLSRSPDFTEFMGAAAARMDALGVGWESWSAETASGQAEINIGPTDPLSAADHVVRAKLALREVAADLGRSVTFMALADAHLGASMHVNLSVLRDGVNQFHSEAGLGQAPLLRSWAAGLLATLPGAMSIFSPTVNSYRRLVEIAGPPTTLTWGEANKSTAVRTVTHDPGSARIEHRVPAVDCNPYLALSAILAGGLIGMADELVPPEPYEGMAWGLEPDAAPRIPNSIMKAADALESDARLADLLGREAVEYWVGSRRWEWLTFHRGGGDPDEVTEYELSRYFEEV
jgi:glutamine synthetase